MNWTVAVQFILAVVGGAVGAWVVHRLDFKSFCNQEQYRDKQKRRDVLRGLLARESDMRAILGQQGADAQAKASELAAGLEEVRPMFITNEDVAHALRRAAVAVSSSITVRDHDFTVDFEESMRVLKAGLRTLEDSLSK